MKGVEYRLLQALLWFACLSHVVIGAGIMVSPEFQRTMAGIYGAHVDWSPQLVYILRLLGAFMFVLGLLLAVAAGNPGRHALIVYGLCGVLLLRVVQRVLFRQEIEDTFRISQTRDLAMAGLFLVEALVILILLRRVGRSRAAAE